MNREALLQLLEEVRTGRVNPEEAAERVGLYPFAESGEGFCLDHQRELRRGFPEVVMAEGKTDRAVEEIVARMATSVPLFLVSRLKESLGRQLCESYAQAVYHPVARMLSFGEPPVGSEGIAIVSAGCADRAVALEAEVTLRWMGERAELIEDVGVAGLHRLMSRLPDLRRARVLIVVAGMEGALPSVIAGLVNVPVIAVPTSVGYGSSFQGLSALLGMLNSCSAGITVVNIDNGFGAAYAARLMVRTCDRGPAS